MATVTTLKFPKKAIVRTPSQRAPLLKKAQRRLRQAWDVSIIVLGIGSLAIYTGLVGYFLVRGFQSPFDAFWTCGTIFMIFIATMSIKHGLRDKPHVIEKHVIIERRAPIDQFEREA